jgi:hypothetical protein
VIADIGSFHLIKKVNELMKYEASMPLKFDMYDGGLRSNLYQGRKPVYFRSLRDNFLLYDCTTFVST